MKALRFVLSAIIAFPFWANAQDMAFMNFNQSLVSLSPSFAGSNGFIRNQLSYRNRADNRSVSRVNYTNALDGYLPFLRAGVGISVFSEDQLRGTYRRAGISLSYAKYLEVGKEFILVPAIQVTTNKCTLDPTVLHYGDIMYANTRWVVGGPELRLRRQYVDYTLSALGNYRDKLYVGGVWYHVTRPDRGHQGSDRLPARFLGHVSYYLVHSEKLLLQAYYSYARQQKIEHQQLALNAVAWKHLLIGAGYYSPDQAMVSAGVRGSAVAIQASYMTGFSKSSVAQSLEIHVSINVRRNELRRSLVCFEEM